MKRSGTPCIAISHRHISQAFSFSQLSASVSLSTEDLLRSHCHRIRSKLSFLELANYGKFAEISGATNHEFRIRPLYHIFSLYHAIPLLVFSSPPAMLNRFSMWIWDDGWCDSWHLLEQSMIRGDHLFISKHFRTFHNSLPRRLLCAMASQWQWHCRLLRAELFRTTKSIPKPEIRRQISDLSVSTYKHDQTWPY